MDWTEHMGMFVNAGDVGGDAQSGHSNNRRWHITLPNGERALIDAYTFPVYFDEDDETDKRRLIGWHIEHMVCTDLDDPGGSEVWSEGTWATVGEEIATPAMADVTARLMLENFDPAMIDWCGSAAHPINHQHTQAYLRALSGLLFCDRVFAAGWRDKINLATLDVDHDWLCVLGQADGSSYASFEAMVGELALSTEDCVRLGFYGIDGIRRPDDIAMLNEHWRRLLTPKS